MLPAYAYESPIGYDLWDDDRPDPANNFECEPSEERESMMDEEQWSAVEPMGDDEGR